MLRVALIVTFTFIYVVEGQPDTSRCARCDELFIPWSRNKTRSSWWTEDKGAKQAADEICSWGRSIYDDCYYSCARDPSNHTLPGYTGSFKARALKKFISNSCYDHACRTADFMYCLKHTELPEGMAPAQKPCTDEVLNCEANLHDENGCNDNHLCDEAERRSFAEKLKSRMNCHFGSATILKEDVEPSREDNQHIQHCKDILLSQCLKQWNDDYRQIDMNRFVKLSATNQLAICGDREQTQSCLNQLDNDTLGAIEYLLHNYTQPCRPHLLQYPDELKTIRDELFVIYQRLCDRESDSYIRTTCAEEWQTTTKSSNFPKVTANPAVVSDIETATNSVTNKPPTVHDHGKGVSTEAAKGFSNKLEVLVYLVISALTLLIMF